MSGWLTRNEWRTGLGRHSATLWPPHLSAWDSPRWQGRGCLKTKVWGHMGLFLGQEGEKEVSAREEVPFRCPAQTQGKWVTGGRFTNP